jgi:hypothetical protein
MTGAARTLLPTEKRLHDVERAAILCKSTSRQGHR